MLFLHFGSSFFSKSLLQEERRDFAERAFKIEDEIENTIDSYVDLLYALRGFYDASDYVSRSEFETFIQYQELDKRLPGLTYLEYINYLEANDLEEYILNIHEEGFEDFEIKPYSQKNDYYIVNYSYPFDESSYGFGYDIGSNNLIVKNLNEAVSRDRVSITDLVDPVQIEGNKEYFVIILPDYKKNSSASSIEKGGKNINGFFAAIIDPEKFLTNFNGDPGVSFSLHDKDDHIYSSDEKIITGTQSGLTYQNEIKIGLKSWIYQAVASDMFFADYKVEESLKKAIPFVGLVLSFFIYYIYFLISQSYIQAKKVAKSMTRSFNAERRKTSHQNEELKKLSLVAEKTDNVVVITNRDGVTEWVNPAFELLTGYSLREVVGKKPGDLLQGPGTDPKTKKKFSENLAKKKSFSITILNYTKTGREYMLQADVSPIFGDSGEIEQYIAIERDVTKEIEVDRAKTEFVSLASHQLRTPLSTVAWFSEKLLAGDAGKITRKQKDYLKEIHAGNQRMIGLVNELLDVSRLEMGAFGVRSVKVNPASILKKEIDLLDQLINKKDIKIVLDIDLKNKEMQSDENLLSIIFQNVLSNAVKYSHKKGRIKVTLKEVRRASMVGGKKIAKGKLVYIIEDDGCGIPEKQQGRIFSKLFRADNVKGLDTHGTGLGMYIVKSIVEKIDGKIWFDSEEDKGTTFYVTLPMELKKQGRRIGIEKKPDKI